MKYLLIFPVVLMCSVTTAVAQYGGSLYADVKGRSVGDIISIIIVENANASRGTKKKSSSNSEMSAGGSLGGDVFQNSADLGFSTSANTDYDGSESSQQSEQLTGRISVRITEQVDGGLYRISGERKISVNGEENLMKIEGFVRGRDISPSNMVYSHNVADMQISYQKTGFSNSLGQGFFTGMTSKIVGGLLLGVAIGALSFQ